MNSMNNHRHGRRSRVALGALVVISILVAACSSTVSIDATPSSTTSATDLGAGETTETTVPATAAEVLADAVEALTEADSYAFEAKILISLQGEPTEIELKGWVDGSDRELVMTINRESVTTRVIDGIATVERDGETIEVALEEAGESPSIEVLASIQNPTFESDSTITGKLNASDLAGTNYDVNGSADITVTISADGVLPGYSIAANNDSWSVEATFTDVGDDSF